MSPRYSYSQRWLSADPTLGDGSVVRTSNRERESRIGTIRVATIHPAAVGGTRDSLPSPGGAWPPPERLRHDLPW